MKQRLDAIEAKLQAVPPSVDAIDWTGAPDEVQDALEIMQALAETLPAGMSAAEKHGRIGLMDEGFAACKTVAKWVEKKCPMEATL